MEDMSDTFKCIEVELSYMCNNISTPMAPLLYIRLRWDLRSDFLTCAITFWHQWVLCSVLDWGETCSSLQGSCKFNKDWQRHQGNKRQIEIQWPELHHAQQSSTHLIQSTIPRPTSNEMFAWFGGVASPRHVNVMGREATSLLQQAADATHACVSAWECRSMQAVTTGEG